MKNLKKKHQKHKKMKEYRYEVLGKDMYKVVRIDEKLPKGQRYKEYLIDLKGTDWLCDCKGFYYTKMCKHIKFLLSQLKDDGGILNFDIKNERFI